jgi:hypothetical protein
LDFNDVAGLQAISWVPLSELAFAETCGSQANQVNRNGREMKK